MEKDLNKIVHSAKFPLWQQFKGYLIFLLNRKGKILHKWDKVYFQKESISQRLRRADNIFDMFDIGQVRDLEKVAKTFVGFPGKAEYFSLYGEQEFYTQLPTCNLTVNALGKGLFLGVISHTNLLPNIYYPESGAMVFVDKHDKVLGFNSAFFNHFKERFPAPQEMLNLPCINFFVPTPSQIQATYFASFKEVPRQEYRETYTLGPADIKAGKVELSSSQIFNARKDGFSLDNQTVDHHFLTLAAPVNLMETDVRLDMEFDLSKGYPPLIVFGTRSKYAHDLDAGGYAVGVNVARRTVFLKKFGYQVAESEKSHDAEAKAYTYCLKKTDQAFCFAITQEEFFKYFDFDFIDSRETYISIVLRPGTSITIRRLSVKAHNRPDRLEKQDAIVRLSIPSENYFALNHFYTTGLSSNFPYVYSYLLQNVTNLKASADRFQNLYQDQKKEGERLRSILFSEFREKEGLFIGNSSAITAIRENADLIADSNVTILIQGDTGTGKEVLAKYIHQKSPFKRGPFVKVDCSTLAPNLVESELFGHEKGAFTGAFQTKRGKFEQAGSGTLFLDEVNNLSLEVQAKLLNFLQDFTITRVGGEKPIRLNLRIIIASNIRLDEMVKKGVFREDLYFRINIVNIELPPLVERLDDIPDLCEYFLEIFNVQHSKHIKRLSSRAYQKLYAHKWPGNVRELKNVLHRAIIFCSSQEIEEDHIAFSRETSMSEPVMQRNGHGDGLRKSSKRPWTGLTRDNLIGVLKRNQGNIKQTAREIGMARQSLYYRIKGYNININDFRNT